MYTLNTKNSISHLPKQNKSNTIHDAFLRTLAPASVYIDFTPMKKSNSS